MSRSLRVGIAGYGGAGMAQHWHFDNLGCRVVSVYDPKQVGLDRARRRAPSLRGFEDFSDFLDSGVDVVAICTPDETHAALTVASLRAGKHVLCEKPLSNSVQGCRDILAAEKSATGCVAAVQHQMRFLPVHQRMREVLRAGTLGPLSYLEGYYVHNLVERSRVHDDWRFEGEAHPLLYAGCHFVDLMRWFLREEVLEIEGMANHRAFPTYPECDFCVVLLRFESDVIGKVVTALAAGRPQDHSVRIYGRDRCIDNNVLLNRAGELKVMSRPMLFPRLPPAARLASRISRTWRNVSAASVGTAFEALLKVRRRQDVYAANGYPMRLYEHDYAVQRSIADFLDAIAHGRRPVTTLKDAAKTVATCVAGVEALREGRRIDVRDKLLQLDEPEC